MYTDKKRKRWPWLVLVICVVAIAAVFYLRAPGVSDDMAAESAEALRAAVQRSANQCYAVEGVYPPDLEYLEEHYGLQVNHRDFYVIYDAFASNLPPTIRVTPKGK